MSAFAAQAIALNDVLSMIVRRGFVHAPVVDGQSRPLCIVNAREALQALLAEEQYEESLLRNYAWKSIIGESFGFLRQGDRYCCASKASLRN